METLLPPFQQVFSESGAQKLEFETTGAPEPGSTIRDGETVKEESGAFAGWR